MFSKRILHEHIAINADRSEKKNAGVEVGMQHVSVDDTEHVPINPLSMGITSHQHGEGTQKSQVTDREVKKIDVTAIPVLQTEEVAKNNQAIANDAHNELNPIKNGKVVLFQGSLCCQPAFARCIPCLKKREKNIRMKH